MCSLCVVLGVKRCFLMYKFARPKTQKIRITIRFSDRNADPMLGGDGETRTLAPVSRPTPLAGAPRHQLEYISVLVIALKY